MVMASDAAGARRTMDPRGCRAMGCNPTGPAGRVSPHSGPLRLRARLRVMKSKTVFAFILITVGVIALVYQGISWTTREKAVDLGPIEITAEKSHRIPLPPIIGGVALALGLLMLVSSRKTA